MVSLGATVSNDKPSWILDQLSIERNNLMWDISENN